MERARIFRYLSDKDPATWSKIEVCISLESWGLPMDIATDLAREKIPNGREMLRFDSNASVNELRGVVPQLGYRKLIVRNVIRIKQQTLLRQTYGNENGNLTKNTLSLTSGTRTVRMELPPTQNNFSSSGSIRSRADVPLRNPKSPLVPKPSMGAWTTAEVVKWIETTPLASFAPTFEEKQVDGARLLGMTESNADFSDLDMKIGPRKALIRLIKEYQGDTDGVIVLTRSGGVKQASSDPARRHSLANRESETIQRTITY